MKINPRIYDYANEENLIETQELNEDKHKLEIYSLNEYPDMLEEYTAKGKFAVWSSVDGKNYRLFIEKGYLEKVKPLYSKKINGIWLDFWDKCDRITSKFKNIVYPSVLIVLVIIFLVSIFAKGMGGTIALIIVAALFFVGLLIFRRITNNKFTEANKESVDEIKKYLGAKEFENLLDVQRSYLDEYFGYDKDESDTITDDASSEEKEEIEIVETKDDKEE